MSVRIALAAGHRNADGGNALERELVAEHCWHVAQALRRAGADVRVVTPQDGRGVYPGGLQAVGQQVVNWHTAGWRADVFIEFHTNAPGGRGVFVIYPDAGSDVDGDVRGELGRWVAADTAAAMGLPVWGNGRMSEKDTGVGRQGHRLGVFLRTAPIRTSCTRFLIESGFHSDPRDLAVLRQAETSKRLADGLVRGLSRFYTLQTEPPKPAMDPNARFFEDTGHWIVNQTIDGVRVNMLQHFDTGGGLGTCGYPLAGMTRDRDGVFRQLCENVLLEYWPQSGVYRFGAVGRRYRDCGIEFARLQSEHEICDCG